MKTEFKNFCKVHKMKFEGIKEGNFIASKLVPRYVYRMAGKGLKREIAEKNRKFYVFDNPQNIPFDFSEKFSYTEIDRQL